jgi:hypothetical protein
MQATLLSLVRARFTLTAGATVLAFAVMVAGAGALVLLYKNSFSSRGEFNQLRLAVGSKKTCKKFWRGKKAFGIKVKKGPVECSYRTPVTGDADRPDHDLSADARVAKSTEERIQKHVFVSVSVRANKDSGYQLRVFPKKQTWEVRRKPNGTGFPIASQGTDDAINPVGKKNAIRIRAFGDLITASINGKKVVTEFKDPNPSGDVKGRRTFVSVGNNKKKKGKAAGFIDDVEVRIPNP